MPTIVLRYGEIWLKGLNKSFFEDRFIKNIKFLLKKNNIEYDIKNLRARILLKVDKKVPDLKRVFGITSYSYAKEIDLDLKKIKKEVLKLCKKGKTFRITTKRLSKDIALSSQEINEIVGDFVVKKLKLKVNLKNAEQDIFIEILNKKAYLFDDKKDTIECFGGLPVGVSGLCTLILDNKNSILAGIMMLKRGCSLEIIRDKKISYKKLEIFSSGTKIKEVKHYSDYSYAVVDAGTLKNFKERNCRKMALRPLINLSQEDIDKKLKYFC